MKECKFYATVMEMGAVELSLGDWQNSVAYRLIYHDGLDFTR